MSKGKGWGRERKKEERKKKERRKKKKKKKKRKIPMLPFQIKDEGQGTCKEQPCFTLALGQFSFVYDFFHDTLFDSII